MKGDSRLNRRALLVSGGAALVSASCAGSLNRHEPVPLIYDEFGSLYVSARINDGPSHWFILDTGASHSLVDENYARDAGIALRPGEPVEGTAGVVDARQATLVLQLPGEPPREVDIPSYGFGCARENCIGIVGSDLLRHTPFQLDYRNGVLTWHPPRPRAVTGLLLDNGIPRINVVINDVRIALRIDTGAALSPDPRYFFNLTRDQASEVGLDDSEPVAVWQASGTGGQVLSLPVHRLDSAIIGNRELAPAFAIIQPPVGYFSRPEAVGFVGNAVLDKLTPYFDYARHTFGMTV